MSDALDSPRLLVYLDHVRDRYRHLSPRGRDNFYRAFATTAHDDEGQRPLSPLDLHPNKHPLEPPFDYVSPEMVWPAFVDGTRSPSSTKDEEIAHNIYLVDQGPFDLAPPLTPNDSLLLVSVGPTGSRDYSLSSSPMLLSHPHGQNTDSPDSSDDDDVSSLFTDLCELDDAQHGEYDTDGHLIKKTSGHDQSFPPDPNDYYCNADTGLDSDDDDFDPCFPSLLDDDKDEGELAAEVQPTSGDEELDILRNVTPAKESPDTTVDCSDLEGDCDTNTARDEKERLVTVQPVEGIQDDKPPDCEPQRLNLNEESSSHKLPVRKKVYPNLDEAKADKGQDDEPEENLDKTQDNAIKNDDLGAEPDQDFSEAQPLADCAEEDAVVTTNVKGSSSKKRRARQSPKQRKKSRKRQHTQRKLSAQKPEVDVRAIARSFGLSNIFGLPKEKEDLRMTLSKCPVLPTYESVRLLTKDNVPEKLMSCLQTTMDHHTKKKFLRLCSDINDTNLAILVDRVVADVPRNKKKSRMLQPSVPIIPWAHDFLVAENAEITQSAIKAPMIAQALDVLVDVSVAIAQKSQRGYNRDEIRKDLHARRRRGKIYSKIVKAFGTAILLLRPRLPDLFFRELDECQMAALVTHLRARQKDPDDSFSQELEEARSYNELLHETSDVSSESGSRSSAQPVSSEQ